MMLWGIAISCIAQTMYGMSYAVGSKWFLFSARLLQGFAFYQSLPKLYTSATTGLNTRTFWFLIFGTCALAAYFLANLFAWLADKIAQSWTGKVFHRLEELSSCFMRKLWWLEMVNFIEVLEDI